MDSGHRLALGETNAPGAFNQLHTYALEGGPELKRQIFVVESAEKGSWSILIRYQYMVS